MLPQIPALLEGRFRGVCVIDACFLRVPDAQRVPELVEASQTGQEDARGPADGSVEAEDREEPERRSWWRRVFGG